MVAMEKIPSGKLVLSWWNPQITQEIGAVEDLIYVIYWFAQKDAPQMSVVP